MADLIHAILLSLIVLLVPFCFYFLFRKSKKQDVDRKLPPGQSGWPVIEETLEFLSSGWKGHLDKFIFDRMAKFSPHVFRTSFILEDVAVFYRSAGLNTYLGKINTRVPISSNEFSTLNSAFTVVLDGN
ncbi:hypothetical protein Tco_1402167 [Tanacetum coccineum]